MPLPQLVKLCSGMIEAGKVYIGANKLFVSGIRDLSQHCQKDGMISVRLRSGILILDFLFGNVSFFSMSLSSLDVVSKAVSHEGPLESCRGCYQNQQDRGSAGPRRPDAALIQA